MSEQINMLDEAYAQGFIAKCAELGVDPEAVAKAAECVTSGESYKDIEASKGKSKRKPKASVKVEKIKEAFAKLADCGSDHGSSGEAYKDISKSKAKKSVKVKKVKEAFAKLAAFRKPRA